MSFFTSTSFLFSAGILLGVLAVGSNLLHYQSLQDQARYEAAAQGFKSIACGFFGMLVLFLLLYALTPALFVGDIGLKSLGEDKLTKCVPSEPRAPKEKGHYTQLVPC